MAKGKKKKAQNLFIEMEPTKLDQTREEAELFRLILANSNFMHEGINIVPGLVTVESGNDPDLGLYETYWVSTDTPGRFWIVQNWLDDLETMRVIGLATVQGDRIKRITIDEGIPIPRRKTE